MGLLAEIYVSNDSEAVSYDRTPHQFADREEFTGITSLELSTLWAIMQGLEWEDEMLDDFPCLLEVDEGERLIQSLPQTMVTALAAMPADRLASVTSEWAATEEMNCKPEEARPIVDGLVRLARLASESGKKLYLWNSV